MTQPTLDFTSATQAEEALLNAIGAKELCWQQVVHADEQMRLAFENLELALARHRVQSEILTTVLDAVTRFTATGVQMLPDKA